MSYTWSGGSEVVYSDSNKITGLMVGTLIAADTLVEEEPFARLVRAYGAPDMRDTVVMSGGTLWLQNTNTSGASLTNLTINPVASVGASSIKNGAPEMTVVNGATVSGFNAKLVMRNLLANDVTVQNSAWISLSSGGTLTRLNVYTGGSATFSGAADNAVTLNSAVLSGGGKITTLCLRGNTIANDLTFQEGGSAIISGGPVINDIKFYAGANGVISGAATSQISIEGMVVSGAPVKYTKEVSGKTSTYLSAMTTATVYLRDGVSANNVTVHSGGFVLVSGGATVTDLHVSGNAVGSTTPDQTMALVNVYNGGYVSGGEATKLARVMISQGGVIEDMVFHTSTHIYALAGGLLSGGTARTVNLEIRNGTVRGTLVDSGGKLNFTRAAGSGFAIDVTIGSRGSAYVNSGGTMINTLVSGGNGGAAIVHVSSGAAVSTTVTTSGAMNVSKLAWFTPAVTSTTLTSYGSMELYGVASETVARDWGRMNVRSGGTAFGVTLDDGGKTYIYSGGSVDAVNVNANGYLYLYAGGTATNIVENGGFAWGQAGATLTFLDNAFSDVTLNSHATLHSGTTGTNIRIYGSGPDTTGSGANLRSAIAFGGIIRDIEVFSGGVIYVASGHISGATVHSGGYFNIAYNNNKTFVSGAMIESGASMTIQGGSVQNVTISGAFGAGATTEETVIAGAAHLDVYNGTLDSLTVVGVGGFYGSANVHDDVNKRIAAVISGGTVNSLTIADAGYVTVSGATVNDVVMSKGAGIVASCYVNGNKSSMNTRLCVYSNGLVHNVKIVGVGQTEVFVYKGGIVSGIDANSKAFMGAYTGGTIKGGIASGKGASLQGRAGMISGITLVSSADMWVSTGTVRGNNFISGAYLRLGNKGANAVADSTLISGGYGELYQSGTSSKWAYRSGYALANVSSGGKLTNSLIGDGATVLVRNSGVVSNTALLGLNTYNANTQDASLMARLLVSGGAVWKGGDVLKHAQMIIYSGASAEGITMGSGAHVYISANATATDMVVDGATDFAIRGGTAENTVVKKGLFMVSNGGVSGTTIYAGTMRLLSGGAVASDTTVSGGTLSGGRIGTFYNTTVCGKGYLYADGGTYNNTVVSSGASMRILAGSGAVINGLTIEDGAYVELNLSGFAGGAAAIDSLENVDEITVMSATNGTTYTIAATGNSAAKVGAWYQGFHTVFGPGEYINPLYGGYKYTVGDDCTTFKAEVHNMSGTILTTEAADLATSGAVVNGGDKATMWTDVQLGSALTFATSAAGITGDAWIDLDRTKAAAGAAIYGAEGDCMSNATIRYLVHGAGSVGNFAGGATAGGVVGGVELVGYNNTYGQTYLGGMGTVAGLVSARVSSGNTLAKDFFAGALANYAKTGAVTSVGGINTTIALHMSAGTSKETKYYAKGNIYGASQVKAGTVTTAATVHSVGDVVLTINNGETTKGNQMCVFAAGYATGNDADKALPVYTVGTVTATIAGGTWITGDAGACGGRGIFGGAFAGDNTTAGDAGVWAQVGTVNLTISGGTLGNVYGGGWAQKGAKSEVGNVNLTVKGGTIANVFGGGAHSTSGGTTVTGNVTITVSDGTISGAIYARGQSIGDATGAANVIFTGAKNFTCNVYGYSYVPEQGTAGVGEGATLNFTDYAGTFSGEIGGFDGITFDGNTTMTLGTAAADVSNTAWTFDTAERFTALAKTALLDWSTADFTGDTIAVNLATGNVTEWTLLTATGATAATFNKFDVLVDGTSILAEAIDLDQTIATGAYAGWGFTLEEDTLKFKHLA